MYVCGLGTGRCGTKSLANLLNQQDGWMATHENEPHLSWYDEPDPGQSFRRCYTKHYSDVALYYLPHVERLRVLYPGMRFVCMQRDREATVRSFCKSQPPSVDWFAEGEGWCRSFPNLDGETFEEKARQYWCEYYAAAQELEGDDFRIFPTEWLSDEDGIAEILTFCGVERPRIIPSHVR